LNLSQKSSKKQNRIYDDRCKDIFYVEEDYDVIKNQLQQVAEV